MKHAGKVVLCLCIAVVLTGANCEQCPTDCETCTDNATCNSCHDGFWLSGSSCLQCSNNCATCLYSAFCHTCKPEYYWPHTNCTSECSRDCLNSECDDTDGTCTACPSDRYGNYCKKDCTLCKNEKCNKTRCVDGCKTGYYEEKGGEVVSCLNCSTNCLSCQSLYVCESCKDGFYLRDFGASTSCMQCSTHCAKCTDNYSCLLCEAGYYGMNCEYHCSDTVHNCTVCTGNRWDNMACQQCEHGMVLYNNTCKTAQAGSCPNNCANCAPTNMCMSCRAGWYGSLCNKSCGDEIVNCIECHEQKSAALTCTLCTDQYTLLNGDCILSTTSTVSNTLQQTDRTISKSLTTSTAINTHLPKSLTATTTESTENFHLNTFFVGLFSGFGISICTIILTGIVCTLRRRKQLHRADDSGSSPGQTGPFYENTSLRDIESRQRSQQQLTNLDNNIDDMRQTPTDGERVSAIEIPSTSNDDQHDYSSLAICQDEHVYKDLKSM